MTRSAISPKSQPSVAATADSRSSPTELNGKDADNTDIEDATRLASRRAPATQKTSSGRRRGRPARTGAFRRLDIEIEEATFDHIEALKLEIGARSTVEVIRHLLRVGFYLHGKVRDGYELQLVKDTKTVSVKLV